MKRVFCAILASLILLAQLPSPVLAKARDLGQNLGASEAISSSTDIIVEKYEIDRNKVRKDDKFIISLYFNKNRNLDNAYVKIDESGSFALTESGSTKKIPFIKDPITNKYKPVDFKLKYNGLSNIQLPITISYEINGQSYKIDDYVSISQAVPYVEPEKEPDKEDEKEGDPSLVIIGDKTTVGDQGERVSLSFKVKNTSNVSAYNITGSLDLADSGDGLYLDGSGYDDLGRLSSGDDKSMSFRVNIDEFAEDKTYPIKVNFHFDNNDDVHFTSSDTVYIRVRGQGNDQQLIIDHVFLETKGEDEVKPGSEIQALVVVKNLSIVPGRDIQVSIEGLETDKFSLSEGVNKRSVSIFAGRRTETFSFPIKVSQKLKSGNHQLQAKVSYKNLRNQKYEDESIFFIPVRGASQQNSSMIIENVKLPKKIGPDQTASLSFDLRNRGQDLARDLVITAELPDTDGLVPRSVSTIKIDELGPEEIKNIVFEFYAGKKAPTKNYPINIKVEHLDDFSEGDEKYELKQPFGIFVDNPEEDGKTSTPKLIIDKYSFSSSMVQAGSNFDMHLSFFNTNSSKTVKNIKIFLTAEPTVSDDKDSPNAGSSVFTPVNSSNTFYIDSIAPKGRVSKSITMYTVPDAKAKTHIITANFEYEDEKAEEYKAEELIGVPVIQQSKLEVGELQYQSEGFVGMEEPISVEFYNTGKVTLYNMMVKLEGNFQSESSSYYVGNFSTGTSEFFEGYIRPTEEGELTGDLVFTYEDSLGETQELRESFTMNVMADMEPEFPNEFPDMEEEQGFFSKNKKWILPLGLGAGGFGAFKLYKKRKKKKEDEDLLIDE